LKRPAREPGGDIFMITEDSEAANTHNHP